MNSAIITRSPLGRFRGFIALSQLLVIVLLLITGSALSAAVVEYRPGQPVAQERSGAMATFELVRDNSSGSLDVNVEVVSASMAVPADYRWDWLSPTGWQEVGALNATTGTVSFQDTQSTISMRIFPENDALVEGREELSLGIVLSPTDPPVYSRGARGTVTVVIADDDHKANISVIRATADEDLSLRGNDPADPMGLRRAIVRVVFDNFANTPTYATRTDFARNLSVDIKDALTEKGLPNATKDTDYKIKYKICGHNNPATATDNFGQIGLANNASGWNYTTGLDFQLMAALANENVVPLKAQESDDMSSNTIPDGTTFYFESDPDQTVYTSDGDAITALQFTPALNRPVPSGTAVKIIALGPGGTSAPDSVTVERKYPATTRVLRLGGGSGGLYEGDVISIGTDPNRYVIVSDPVLVTEAATGLISARITIFAYEGGGSGGLVVEQTTAAPVTTMLTPTYYGANKDNMQIGVPDISTRVEFSIEPTSFGDGVELAEYVLLSMTADNNYIIQGSSEALLTIADRDLIAGVTMHASAGLPNIPGSFRFTLSQTYDQPVAVEFDLYSRTLDNLGVPTTTDAEGVTFDPISRRVVFARNTQVATLTINPINSATTPPATLTVTLRGSDSYKTGGGTSGFNPSATMIVNTVVGTVTLAATDGTAVEGGTNNGQFRVTLTQPSGAAARTSPLPIKLSVGGTAVDGRYEFFNPSTPSTTYSVSSGALQGISIPVGTNVVDIGVRALENESADAASSVQLTVVNSGTNYVTGTQSSAVVNILDNEPVLGVYADEDAVLPSTPGRFLFSYPGSTVSQQVTIRYTFSDAVRGTDFDSVVTLAIPGNSPSRSAELLINPRATTTATSVTVTLTADSAYHIDPAAATATIQFIPEDEFDPNLNKPTPGTVGSSSSSGGGCGLGSGVSTLGGLLLFAWISLRRSRILRNQREH